MAVVVVEAVEGLAPEIALVAGGHMQRVTLIPASNGGVEPGHAISPCHTSFYFCLDCLIITVCGAVDQCRRVPNDARWAFQKIF